MYTMHKKAENFLKDHRLINLAGAIARDQPGAFFFEKRDALDDSR